MSTQCETGGGVMRRTVVNKMTATRAVIMIFAVLIILSVYPLRLWQRTITEHGDAEVVQISERINDYHDAVQKFIAQYDRIDSVDVYVDNLEKGKYMKVTVYKPTMEIYYSSYVYLGDENLPGYVHIPLKLDLEVGETYTLLLNGAMSTFYVGYGASDLAVYPYILNFLYHDTDTPGVCLAAKYNYEQPISKQLSFLIIVAVIAVAALMCVLTWLFGRNKKEKYVTVHQVIRWVGNPIAMAITLALMIMIFPLKMFDARAVDIIFFEIGVMIAGFIMLYAINHENDATLSVKIWHNIHNFLKMSMIAAAMWFCCEYMNAFYTIYQTLAERKEMICLLLLLCLMIPAKRLANIYNLIYIVVAAIAGTVYRSGHLMAETEKEYDLNNAALTYGVIIVVILGFILINVTLETISLIKDKNRINNSRQVAKGKSKVFFPVSITGIFMVLFGAALVIFRNTRWWGVVLSLFTLLLIWCYGVFESHDERKRKGLPELIIGGLLLNFVVSMVYCWLYRNYAAFNTGRFPFVFHTVTVTAEYMSVMVCASMVLLLYKIYDTRDIPTFRNRFKYLWKEFVLFGFVTSYMIFTMSRTAYLACIVMYVAVTLITTTDNKKQKLKYLLRQFCTLAAAVILCFPAAFTLQRIFPAIYAHPKTYMIENQNYALNGGADPASRHYMGIERFVDLFSEKILGKDFIQYNYPEDPYNYDENGNLIYGETGVLLTENQSANRTASVMELLSSSETDAETYDYLMESAGEELIAAEKAMQEAAEEAGEAQEESVAEETADESQENTDSIENFSNGRLTIFKSYLEQMNFWGHDEMGATLPWGEVAIHAHNTYIQVMYDNGIIAGILFAGMLVISFIAGGKFYLKKRDEVPGALVSYAMVVCFGVASVSEWVFQFSNPMTIALILSLLPITLKEKK